MAKKVVKYLLEGVGTIPTAIADGGYWPVGSELVGVTVDDAHRYVAASYVSMSKADLISRLSGMDIKNQDGSSMSADDKLVALNVWLAMVGLPDLA